MISISSDIYKEINDGIREKVLSMDSGTGSIDMEFFFADMYIVVKADVLVETSMSHFTDEAWGATKSFTEVHKKCTLKDFDVEITDEEYEPVNSDFDLDNVISKYEETNWI